MAKLIKTKHLGPYKVMNGDKVPVRDWQKIKEDMIRVGFISLVVMIVGGMIVGSLTYFARQAVTALINDRQETKRDVKMLIQASQNNERNIAKTVVGMNDIRKEFSLHISKVIPDPLCIEIYWTQSRIAESMHQN